MSQKIVVAGTVDVPTYTPSEMTILDSVVAIATAPLSIFTAEETEFYSKQTMGKAALAFGMGGFVAGDLYGHKVPVLGQRRAL